MNARVMIGVLLAGCGGGSAAPPADAGTRPIFLDVVNTLITAKGTHVVPNDDLYPPANILAPDGPILAVGYGGGHYEALAVPLGQYLLEIGSDFFELDAAHLDAGDVFVGRPPTLIGPGRSLSLELDGLSPWAAGDVLSLASAYAHANMQLALTPTPAPGATSLSSSADMSYTAAIDTNLGDDAWIYQTSLVAGAAPWYARITASAMLPSFNVNHPLTMSLVATQPDRTVTLAADTAAFAAEIGSKPIVQLDFRIAVVPGTADAVHPSPLDPTLVDIDPTGAPAGTFAYANPFPADWTPYVRFDAIYQDGPALAAISTFVALDQATTPIAPLVGVPRSVRVDEISVTPTLSWDAPAFGSPDAYRIEIYRTDRAAPVATFWTRHTSMKLPRVLFPGQGYFAVIGAIVMPHTDRSTILFRESLPLGIAQAATGVFTP